jgi:hypothetical protein
MLGSVVISQGGVVPHIDPSLLPTGTSMCSRLQPLINFTDYATRKGQEGRRLPGAVISLSSFLTICSLHPFVLPVTLSILFLPRIKFTRFVGYISISSDRYPFAPRPTSSQIPLHRLSPVLQASICAHLNREAFDWVLGEVELWTTDYRYSRCAAQANGGMTPGQVAMTPYNTNSPV